MIIQHIIDRILSVIHTWFISMRKGISLGSSTIVHHRAKITLSPAANKTGGRIIIGKNCKVGASKLYYHGGMPFYSRLFADGNGSVIDIGDNCRINGAYIHAQASIRIGKNCIIASGVNIMDSNGHQVTSYNRTVGRDNSKEIEMGNNVWIGINAIILKGTVIGDNSIISAGSVVRGIVPPDSIYSSTNEVSLKSIIY